MLSCLLRAPAINSETKKTNLTQTNMCFCRHRDIHKDNIVKYFKHFIGSERTKNFDLVPVSHKLIPI